MTKKAILTIAACYHIRGKLPMDPAIRPYINITIQYLNGTISIIHKYFFIIMPKIVLIHVKYLKHVKTCPNLKAQFKFSVTITGIIILN